MLLRGIVVRVGMCCWINISLFNNLMCHVFPGCRVRTKKRGPPCKTRFMSRAAALRWGAVASAVLLATLFGSNAVADSPTDIADARFAALNGPMAGFVVRPDAFGMDATKVLADVPALLDEVDGARAKAFVESIAFPLTSAGAASARQQATDLVTDTFRDAGYEPQFQSVAPGTPSNDMPNISAEVPGTQCSDKVLVVSAHYDSITAGNPAADDDGTGMAGLFEIARALRNHPLPITVRLVAFSHEENGLVGSQAMAAKDAAEGTDIVGAVSMDMIGFTKPDIDPLTGVPANYLAMVADPTSAPLARAFGAAAYTYDPAFPAAAAIIPLSVLPDIFRSDHAPFVWHGYQGLLATDTGEFRNPNYHTVNDTLSTIDWDFLTDSTRTLLAGVATYASSDQNTDGTADHCPTAVAPITTAPDTAIPTPTSPGATLPTPPAVAEPVDATPTYTG